MRRHLFAAKYAAARVPGLFSKSTHAAPIIPHYWTSCPLGGPGCTCLFANRRMRLRVLIALIRVTKILQTRFHVRLSARATAYSRVEEKR
jgi:hypothetical protein